MKTLLCCVLMCSRWCDMPCPRWQRSYLCWTLASRAGASRYYKCLCVICRMSPICSPNLKHGMEASFCHLSVLWFSHLPCIYDHFKKPCIDNFLPQMRSNIYRALPTTISITINVNNPLHLSPFYYNVGNVKCICNSGKTVMAPRLSNVNFCNAHSSLFTYCFSLHFVNWN